MVLTKMSITRRINKISILKTNHNKKGIRHCIFFLLRAGGLWVLWGFFSPVFSQLPDYDLQQFGYSYGIRAGNTIAFERDLKGFLWILNPRLVQRFDGKQTRDFPVPEVMYSILCDKKGRVWVRSTQNVYRYINDYHQFRKIPLSAPSDDLIVGALFEWPDQSIGIFTTKGFFRFDETTQQWLPELKQLPLKPPYRYELFGTKNGSFFFGKNKMLYRYNLNSHKLDSLPAAEAKMILPLSADSALITSWKEQTYWYNFHTGTVSAAHLSDTKTGKLNVRSAASINDHEYLMAAEDGLFIYNAVIKSLQRLTLYFNGLPVPPRDFYSHSFIDHQGNVWLTAVDGILRFNINNKRIGLIRLPPHMKDYSASLNNIRRMVEDDKGTIWMATLKGLVSWNVKEHKWQYHHPPPGASPDLTISVRGLNYDGKYILLGPGNTGLWLYDPVAQKYSRPRYENNSDGQLTKELIEADHVNDIIPLAGGDRLILGTNNVYRLNAANYQITRLRLLEGKGFPTMAFAGKNNIVWIITTTGLYYSDYSLEHASKVDFDLGGKPISSGFLREDNTLLFSYDNTLCSVSYKKNNAYVTKLSGQIGNTYLSPVYQDKNKIIWAASENGIYRYDPKTSNLHLYDYSDNIQGYWFNSNAWMRTRSGTLFLAGTNGINYLKPETFSNAADSIAVFIHHVTINNNDTIFYNLPLNPLLTPGQHSIEIEFACPYFNNQDKVKYRYQLAGIDKNWNYIGNNNSVRLFSLSPGDYQLRAQASLDGENWVEASNPFFFRIDTPYWMKWWFIVPASLVILIGGYIIIRTRNKRFRQKQEELETEKAINYFASSLHEHQQIDNILWDVAKNCIGRLQFEDCVIYLLDKEKGLLVQKAAHGPKTTGPYEIKQPITIPLGKGITGSVAASGKAEIIPDTSKDPRYIIDDEVRFSEITVPILFNDEVLGVIDCEHSRRNFFTQKHLSILTTIASLCANKIVRAKAEAERKAAEAVLIDTQQKMADVEMQALRAQMNPHFIFNCLNSINRYIVKSDQATASLYLTKFAKLIRLILDNSHSKQVLLSQELEALRLYIDMESIRFDKRFSYEIIVDKDLSPDSIEVPPLIIQPYVENAIWHGLLHLPGTGHLKIFLSMPHDSMLECTIEDNGVGRARAKELKSKSATSKKSLGMKLTESRLTLLNKHKALTTGIHIIDLYSSTGEAAGTKVIVRIPV